MADDKTKALEKAVADLKKRVASLETQCKAYEAKIKFLADNALSSDEMQKYIGVHMKHQQTQSEKSMVDHSKRMAEMVLKQYEIVKKEVTADNEKYAQAQAKKAADEAQRLMTQAFRNLVLGKIAELEAKVAKLSK